MSFKKDFFSNNFSSFLAENREFFKNYEKTFVKSFTDYLSKLSSNKTNIKKEEIHLFYKFLFLKPFFNDKYQNIKNVSLIEKLSDCDIEYINFFNKLFLILSNNYIKHIVKYKNSVSKLKTLSFLLDLYIKYFEFHKTDECDTDIQIPGEIEKLFINKIALNLLSIYKGIPIAHKTRILDINKNEGIIKVTSNNYQIIAAKLQKEIFLLENDNEFSFRANIKHYSKHKKIMYLNNIEKVQRNSPKRSFIRIHPKTKIDVLLKKDSNTFKSELYDISLKGLCVIGKKSDLKVSDIITIEFILKTDKPHLFITQGEIKSITKLDSKTFRYHVYFELSTHYEYILSKYITKREKEIIKELNSYIYKEFTDLIE